MQTMTDHNDKNESQGDTAALDQDEENDRQDDTAQASDDENRQGERRIRVKAIQERVESIETNILIYLNQ